MADIKEYMQGLKGRTYKKAAETSENDSKSKKLSIFFNLIKQWLYILRQLQVLLVF